MKLPEPRVDKKPALHVYVVVFLLVALLVVGLASFTLMQERDRYRERAVVSTRNIATLLEQHTHDVFEGVELLVRSTELHAEDMIASGHFEKPRFEQYLAQQMSLIPELRGLRVTDEKGRLRYGITERADDLPNVATEAFFMRARDEQGSRAVVVGPVFAPLAQTWVIVFARAIHRPDGSFAGVVYANYPTNAFEKVFSSVQLGSKGAATIRGTDFALVHRVPTTKNAVGSKNVSRELSDIIARSPDAGDYIASTALDGIERSNSYRRLDHYPFYVIVGLATGDSLKGWISSLVLVAGLSGFALLAAGTAAASAYRSQKRLVRDLALKTRLAADLEASVQQRSELNAELAVRLKQAESAAVARDAFLSHVSHEMRTPLHQITGLAELVRKQPLTDRQQEWLNRLFQAAHRMTAMVDQVLEFVKLEAEQSGFSRVPLNPVRLVEQAAQQRRAQAQAAGLSLDVQTDPAVDIELQGDAVRLARSVDALIDNALRHTREGSVRVHCEALSVSAQSALIRFAVTDTGGGVAPLVQARLFDVFAQADLSTTAESSGMGLSLAIVRKMARLMGGDAGCDSQPGTGSTFWFSVRLQRG